MSFCKQRAWVELDLKALAFNYKKMQQVSAVEVMAVVKANAYGHGLKRVFEALSDAQSFAVATLSEAILLRESGCRVAILLLEGVVDAEQLKQAAKYDLDIVFHRVAQLSLFQQYQGKAIRVWLKVDTGMHRLGIAVQDIALCRDTLGENPDISELVLMSHLACADDKLDPANKEQGALFSEIVQQWDGRSSLANSAGALNFSDFYYDVVRSGAALYGISSVQGVCIKDQGFKPVLSLKARLIAVNSIKAGDRVGYGGCWEAENDTILGVVSIGYGDGYPRSAKPGTPVSVDGRICPLVGRVSMDMMTVDLGADASETPGCEVELWGSQVAVDDIAKHAGTIAYELALRLTNRVQNL